MLPNRTIPRYDEGSMVTTMRSMQAGNHLHIPLLYAAFAGPLAVSRRPGQQRPLDSYGLCSCWRVAVNLQDGQNISSPQISDMLTTRVPWSPG
jgi:hypothetical protein